MAVFSPRVAASRAHPAPVAPPPITKTSNWKKVVTIELGNNQIKYYTKKYSLCSNILIWLNFSGPFLASAPYETFLKNVLKAEDDRTLTWRPLVEDATILQTALQTYTCCLNTNTVIKR